MIDISLIDEEVLDAILSNLSYDDASPERQKTIEAGLANSSPKELMDKFLNWNGMIGYTDSIIEAWESINAAVIDNPIERILSNYWDGEYHNYYAHYGLTNKDDVLLHALGNKDQSHNFCALAALKMGS